MIAITTHSLQLSPFIPVFLLTFGKLIGVVRVPAMVRMPYSVGCRPLPMGMRLRYTTVCFVFAPFNLQHTPFHPCQPS